MRPYNLIHPKLFFKPISDAHRKAAFAKVHSLTVADHCVEALLKSIDEKITLDKLESIRHRYIVTRELMQQIDLAKMLEVDTDRVVMHDDFENKEPVS